MVDGIDNLVGFVLVLSSCRSKQSAKNIESIVGTGVSTLIQKPSEPSDIRKIQDVNIDGEKETVTNEGDG